MPLNAQAKGRLNAFFNLKNFTDVVTSLPKPETPMTDILFPPAKRKQKTSPSIAVKDIENATGAVPVVVRGSHSYSVNSGKKSIASIEVQPLSMNKFVSGADLNSLIAMGDIDSVKAKLTETVEELKDRTAASTEILVCQALSGKIEYPASIEGGGTDVYTVELGNLKNVGGSKLGASSTLADLQKLLEAQYIAQKQTGAASDVRFLAGDQIYSKIVELVVNATGNVPVQWTDFGCTLFGKYKIMQVSATYALPGETDATDVIDPKSIQTIDLNNTGKLFYAALDDLDAKLQPLPFFATYEEKKDPSGVKVISSSKPLPAFAVSKSTIKKYLN